MSINESQVENYSPVALFVFDRPQHTKRVVDALRKNEGANLTDLYIFSDAAKEDGINEKNVNDVREYIKTITGFKSIVIIQREQNYGLAKNISCGVSYVCDLAGKVIVLEDDLITSPSFLRYMNLSLHRYQNEKKVWHVSGWNYPIEYDKENENVYFWRLMNCWGWATWKDRWEYFKKEPDVLIKWPINKRIKFNLDGDFDFFNQIEENYNGKKNTWAIFWYATIFEHNGLCLNPIKTLVNNIGHDGSGVNCGSKDIYKSELYDSNDFIWPVVIKENERIVDRNKLFYKSITPSFFRKIAQKIKRLILR